MRKIACLPSNSEIGDETDADPFERLLELVDRLLPPEMDDDQLRFRQPFLEIRSQAPHSDAYRDLIERHDDLLHAELAEAIELGVDAGQFRPVNPAQTAEFLLSTIRGSWSEGWRSRIGSYAVETAGNCSRTSSGTFASSPPKRRETSDVRPFLGPTGNDRGIDAERRCKAFISMYSDPPITGGRVGDRRRSRRVRTVAPDSEYP